MGSEVAFAPHFFQNQALEEANSGQVGNVHSFTISDLRAFSKHKFLTNQQLVGVRED